MRPSLLLLGTGFHKTPTCLVGNDKDAWSRPRLSVALIPGRKRQEGSDFDVGDGERKAALGRARLCIGKPRDQSSGAEQRRKQRDAQMTGRRRFIQSFYYYSGSPRPTDGPGALPWMGGSRRVRRQKVAGVRAEGGQAPSWGFPGVSIPFQGKGKAWRGGQVWNQPIRAIPADCAGWSCSRASSSLAPGWSFRAGGWCLLRVRPGQGRGFRVWAVGWLVCIRKAHFL